MSIIGRTDKPIEAIGEDKFKIKDYVEGLSEFIQECDTPMTIAIQGDWGCGKTSMMNMVKQILEETENENKKSDIFTVWFNTWQFSQFNMDEQLAPIFLQHLVNELTAQLGNTTITEVMKNDVIPFLKKIIVGSVKHVAGQVVGTEVVEV